MKILYYNCFAGISGDMNLSAMIDLGLDSDYLLKELNKLKLEDEFKLKITKDSRKGIFGTKLVVEVNDHGRIPHRHFADISSIIRHSELSAEVKQTAIQIFEIIAKAEAKVHNKEVDKVHFHEVGATDSIVDIVGAAIGYHYLKPEKVICSTIELGGGFVNCAHGMIPVPAPATLEILKNIPVKLGTVNYEATTPTGAAILATLVNEYTDQQEFQIQKTAYGIGHKDDIIPNVLMVHIATKEESNFQIQFVKQLECNIDDMTPENISYVLEKLLEEGAMDVHITAIQMKKGRPAFKLTVLCSIEKEAHLKEVIFKETSTLGLKSFAIEKTVLEREESIITTEFGDVRVKKAFLNGQLINQKPEFDDCVVLAKKTGKPLKEILKLVQNLVKDE